MQKGYRHKEQSVSMDSSSDDDEKLVLENGLFKLLMLDSVHFREEWVNEYFTDREEDGEYHRIFNDLLRQPEKFFDYFRMMPNTFFYILGKIAPRITKESNFRTCIGPEEKLMVTLRFLSTGLAFRSMAFSFKLASCTIAGIVYDVCEAIWQELLEDHMPPVNKEVLKSSAEGFMKRWGFPNCVGCVDGKHVRIKCPSNSGSMYYNYKSFFSVVLQGIADNKCKFICIDVGAYGRQSDSGILINTPIHDKLQDTTYMPEDAPLPYSGATNTVSVPHVLLGDQGYPLKTYLLKPYDRNSATEDELYFNYKSSSVRRVIECAFGIVVAKWRVLKTEIQCEPKHVDIIVKCACLLHNIVIDKEGTAEVDSALDNLDETPLITFQPSTDARKYNRSTTQAVRVRDSFKHYFKCAK